MERLVIAAALVVVAAAVAFALNRRRPQAPTQGRAPVPAQLDRADFPDADKPWLLVVWTSRTCASCEQAVAKATPLRSDRVGYAEVPWQDRKDLHDRYGIEDVPLLVLADEEGVVRASFVGTPEFGDLVNAVSAATGS
ncbi:MAG TPA: hypothetical protein VFA84_07585 [Acidimicrobiales bacterium]|nr:hypothetical protein [Acidimicrobiales bacterium]